MSATGWELVYKILVMSADLSESVSGLNTNLVENKTAISELGIERPDLLTLYKRHVQDRRATLLMAAIDQARRVDDINLLFQQNRKGIETLGQERADLFQRLEMHAQARRHALAATAALMSPCGVKE